MWLYPLLLQVFLALNTYNFSRLQVPLSPSFLIVCTKTYISILVPHFVY